jgi:hypothetical protein
MEPITDRSCLLATCTDYQVGLKVWNLYPLNYVISTVYSPHREMNSWEGTESIEPLSSNSIPVHLLPGIPVYRVRTPRTDILSHITFLPPLYHRGRE